MKLKLFWKRSDQPINPNPPPVPFSEAELSDEAKSIRAIIDKMADSDDPSTLKRAEELLAIDFLNRNDKEWLGAYVTVKMAEAQKNIARELFAKMLVDDAPLPYAAGKAINELRKRDLQQNAGIAAGQAQMGNQALSNAYQQYITAQKMATLQAGIQNNALQNLYTNSVTSTAAAGNQQLGIQSFIGGNGNP